MKKILAMVMALCMCFSLASCGSADLTSAKDAYSKAATSFNAVGDFINENQELVSQEDVDKLNEWGTKLTQFKTDMESSRSWTKEEVDTLATSLNEFATLMDELKTQIETAIADGAAAE